MNRTLTAAAALLAAGMAAPAPARQNGLGPSRYAVMLKHLDLHPATPAAARRTLVRLDNAALEVCGASGFGLSETQDAVRRSACWRDSMADVLARIDDPLLTTTFSRHRQ